MTLPDRRPATTTGQPMYQPQPISGVVQPYASMHVEERRVVGYTEHAGMLLPVYETRTEPAVYQQRDLTPQPLLDPVAQRMIGAGIGGGAAAAGIGWGLGEAFSGLAGVGTGTLIWLAILLATAKLPSAMGRPRVTNNTHVTNNNRWLGRSTTTTHQR
jgi:hypothetical protein